ncbi:MAG: ABC transporter ATP-binding protein [Actinomycetota bacterium]|nr:ABC transporter ATP-binding protein [Actinomycetota bacterium]
MPAPAIEVKGLKKSYGSVEAVAGIDLTVAQGEVFALLGPNGAGKTTTVEILEGHRKRSAGEASVLGHDPGSGEAAFKRRIGIVLQETGVNRFLTVAEAIDQFRLYYPSPRPLDEVIEVVGLTDKRNTLVRKLSGGQQRRLDVAVGLAGDPELLFLDEPTTGFDPSARRNAWGMIQNLKSLGKTVFLTTHYMDEAQFLADRVAIIVGGLIRAEGTPDELAAGMAVDTRVTYSVAQEDAAKLEATARGAGIAINQVASAKPSLEEVYLELTKEQPDERPKEQPKEERAG